MNRRISFLLICVLLIGIMVFPASAVQQTYQKAETIHTEFGDIEKVSVLTVYVSSGRSNTKSAGRTDTYKYSGTIVAEVTLSATFGYDGKTTWIVSASGSHTTYNGWSYSGEKITKSGGTATLTATLTHSRNRNVSVNTPLTCSPTGQIS